MQVTERDVREVLTVFFKSEHCSFRKELNTASVAQYLHGEEIYYTEFAFSTSGDIAQFTMLYYIIFCSCKATACNAFDSIRPIHHINGWKSATLEVLLTRYYLAGGF